MTNNYFLHTESLKAKSFEDYQTGMGKLIEIKFRCNQDEHILKHENIYYHDHYLSLCKSGNNEAITAIMQYIEQCESYKSDITNDIIFEQEFPTYNVGFMGIDFSSIEDIEKKRQIIDIDSYEGCKMHYHRKLLAKCDNNKVIYYLSCLFPDYKFEKDAIDDIIYWKNANLSFVADILDLLQDVKEHPFIGGKGKTEVLKNKEGVASKHINDEHRLQYSLKNGQINICRCRGHYV